VKLYVNPMIRNRLVQQLLPGGFLQQHQLGERYD